MASPLPLLAIDALVVAVLLLALMLVLGGPFFGEET